MIMKKLLSLIALLAVTALAQVPPFIRNSLDTNSEAVAMGIVTNAASIPLALQSGTALDWSGGAHEKRLFREITTGTTFTFANLPTSATNSMTLVLYLTNNGPAGVASVTFPAAVQWPQSVAAPGVVQVSNTVTVFEFTHMGGGRVFGFDRSRYTTLAAGSGATLSSAGPTTTVAVATGSFLAKTNPTALGEFTVTNENTLSAFRWTNATQFSYATNGLGHVIVFRDRYTNSVRETAVSSNGSAFTVIQVLTADGNLGVKTNSPGAMLDVNGGIAFNGSIRGQSGSSLSITEFGAAPNGDRGILAFDNGTPTISVAGGLGLGAIGSDAGAGADVYFVRGAAGVARISSGANVNAANRDLSLSNLFAMGSVGIGKGVSADGGGVKHARTTTGSVGIGSTVLVTVTWTTAFADANYTVQASVVDSTTTSLSLSVVHVESVSASAVTVRVLNNSATTAITGTLHVLAVHD